jgi:hypothetical protein
VNLSRTDVVIILLAWVALTYALLIPSGHPPYVPPCQEDEVIVGVGDFGTNGYWSGYECRNLD